MTKGDEFIAEQLEPRLEAGETIEHTAYLETDSGTGVMGGLRKKAYWAGLSSARLFLIEVPVGAFKPLMDTQGIEVIDRTAISFVLVRGATCSIKLADGRSFAFLANRVPKHASGQAGFFDELLARHAAAPEVAQAAAKQARLKMVLGLLAGLVVVGVYAYQELYAGRVEVSVQCSSHPSAGTQCTATHVSGGATARACWQVQLVCNNGARSEGQTCVLVEPEQSKAVSLGTAQMTHHDECDAVNDIVVHDIRLESP